MVRVARAKGASDGACAMSPTITLSIDGNQLKELAVLIAELVAVELRVSADERTPWLTTKQAAEYLCLSADGIHRLTGAGVIPHVKISGRCLFNRYELDDWLRAHRCEATGSVSNSLTQVPN